MKKKLLALILVLMMCLSVLPLPAFADGGDIQVTFTYSKENAIEIPPQTLTVSAGLAYSYGIGDEATQDPTVLDAVVAAHVEKYKEAFTAETADDYMNASLSTVFEDTGYAGHVINSEYSSDYASEAVLKNGDRVDTFLYSASYGDYYASFFQEDIIVKSLLADVGTPLSFTAKGFYLMSFGEATLFPLTELSIGTVGEDGTFTDKGIVTGADGSFSVSFDTAGTYVLATKGAWGATPVVPAWCIVTVNASMSPEEQAEYIRQDKEALTLPAEAIGNLILPVMGASTKTTISWASSDPAVISVDGTVIKQAAQQEVTLTATIRCGKAEPQTKEFAVTVPALSAEEITAKMTAAKKALTAAALAPVEYSGLDGGSYPYEGSVPVDTNILTKARGLVDNAAPGVKVSLAQDFTSNTYFSETGEITYPESYGTYYADISFVLSFGSEEDVAVKVFSIKIPKRATTKAEDFAAEMAKVTEAIVLNGQEAANVTASLKLPVGSSFGIEIDWSSNHPAIEIQTGSSSSTGRLHKVTRPALGEGDAAVTLTAAFDYGEWSKAHGSCEAGPMPDLAERSLSFIVTVPAYTAEEWQALKEEVDAALDTAVIKVFGVHGDLDPAADLTAVTENLMLPNISGFTTVWTSGHPNITAPTYSTGKAVVTRPLDQDTTGTVTLSLTKNGYTATKDVTITVKARTAQELADNIAARLIRDGIGSDGNSPWFAANLGAYAAQNPDKPTLTQEQKDSYVSYIIKTAKGKLTDAATLSKAIISLKALGIDASKLVTAEGTELNLIESLTALVDDTAAQAGKKGAYDIYTLPYVLIALQQDESYATQEQLDNLIASALLQKVGESAWGYDGVAPVALALAPYYESNPEVKEALDNVTSVEYLATYQGDTGAMGTSKPNANSTGLALMGLAALGKNPADYVKNGNSLLDGLLLLSNEKNDYFLYSDKENASATEQGLRGLLSAIGFTTAGEAYRLYDFSANESNPAEESWLGSPVSLSVIPSDAAIKVTAGGTKQTPVSAGLYDLLKGDYSYAISKDGYQETTGTFTVSEEDATTHASQKMSFSLLPNESSEAAEISVQVYVKIHDAGACGNSYTYKNNSSAYSDLAGTPITLSLKKGSSVFLALHEALTQAGIDYSEKSYGYIDQIGDLSEFDHGANSGWLYRVGSVTPNVGCRDYTLNQNSTVTWFYTDDYQNEYGSEEWVETPVAPVFPFVDVEGHWARNAIHYVYDNDLFAGVSTTEFAPEDFMNRAMVWTILHRMEGNDIKTDTEWYQAAQAWAMDENITDGTNPFEAVSRQQFATLLYRYAKTKGYDVSKTGALDAFTDAQETGDYAQEAMQWAVGGGLIQGRTATTLSPNGTTTRAEAATMLMRFQTLVIK